MAVEALVALAAGGITAAAAMLKLAHSARSSQYHRETREGDLVIHGPGGEDVTIHIGRIDREDPKKIERALELLQAAQGELLREKIDEHGGTAPERHPSAA